MQQPQQQINLFLLSEVDLATHMRLSYALIFVLVLVNSRMQDIPDVEGDKVYGIRSFSVRLGQKRVYITC